jgi:hypothetical protein
MQIDRKPDLVEYFKTHYLPPPDWEGWGADKDLTDIKVRVIHQEALDATEFGLWPEDLERARKREAPIIPIDQPTYKEPDIGTNLRRIMEGIGLTDVDVMIEDSPVPGFYIDIEIDKDRRGELIDYVNSHIDSLL